MTLTGNLQGSQSKPREKRGRCAAEEMLLDKDLLSRKSSRRRLRAPSQPDCWSSLINRTWSEKVKNPASETHLQASNRTTGVRILSFSRTQSFLTQTDCYQTPGSRCFHGDSNVHLYSTLTTISDHNRGVNLFLVMPYWPPAFLPSSIIFGRLLLGN